MLEFIENILHQQIEIKEYENLSDFPLIIKGKYELYTIEIGRQPFLLAKPKENLGLTALRKDQKRLEQLTNQYCVLYLTQMNLYSRDKMLEEGIPFIWENRQIYMPFLGILLKQSEARELRPCVKISFLTQKLLLTAIYENWKGVTVTEAAKKLDVSKMSITRCFDEIESLDIPVLEKRARTRFLVDFSDKREIWNMISPYMREPLIYEYNLAENISQNLLKSGISALSAYSLLEDNEYPTFAITKYQLKQCKIKEKKVISKGETPECVIQELGYEIPFRDGTVIDPLTVFLLMKSEREEPRIGKALEEMLEEYVW